MKSLMSLALAVLLAAGSGAAQKKFDKKFSVAPGGTLTVSTDAGSVKIIGGTGSEVTIQADIRGREKDVNRFEVTAEQSGNNVEVKGKAGKSGSSWFWGGTELDVEFVITVPREYHLKMNTSGGNLVVSDVKGSIRGETSGGNIDLAGTEGEVEMETSGGNVRAEKCTGKIHMETSGGEIHIQSINGDVDVETSGGNIKIADVEGKVHAETSGGDVVVKVKGSNKGIYAETSGGNIDVVIPKAVGANIDAATSGGEVHCDLPVTLSGKIDESRVKGTLNGGGNTIHAHTSGGDVRIRALD